MVGVMWPAQAHCPAPCWPSRVARDQDLDACRPPQMDVLYPKARTAFQNLSGSEYFLRIKPYLGEPGRTPGGRMAGPGSYPTRQLLSP